MEGLLLGYTTTQGLKPLILLSVLIIREATMKYRIANIEKVKKGENGSSLWQGRRVSAITIK